MIVRELTENELSYLRDLASRARSHADRAQEYRQLLEGAVDMVLEDEESGVDLDRGVIIKDEEDVLTEEEE